MTRILLKLRELCHQVNVAEKIKLAKAPLIIALSSARRSSINDIRGKETYSREETIDIKRELISYVIVTTLYHFILICP